MEIMTNESRLKDKLRVPAVSRTNKVLILIGMGFWGHTKATPSIFSIINARFSYIIKVFNVQLALNALRDSEAGSPPENQQAKDIVDGHLEKTLGLLWHIIFGFQLEQLLSADRLFNEIRYLENSLEQEARSKNEEAKKGWHFYLECKRRDLENNKTENGGSTSNWTANPKMKLLLKWARLVCAHYGLEVRK